MMSTVGGAHAVRSQNSPEKKATKLGPMVLQWLRQTARSHKLRKRALDNLSLDGVGRQQFPWLAAMCCHALLEA